MGAPHISSHVRMDAYVALRACLHAAHVDATVLRFELSDLVPRDAEVLHVEEVPHRIINERG